MASSASHPVLPWAAHRDPAVDLVRGVAVVCMVIAHVRVWAPIESTLAKIAVTLVNNVASPLFALVMGVSAGIVLTRTGRAVTGGAFVTRNAVRAVLLVLVGLLLVELETFVAIVLMALGATLLVAAPLALLPRAALAVAVVATFFAGPWVTARARAAFDPARVHSDAWADQLLQWFLLSPHYRVVSLLPFVLAGVLLARLGLGRREALAALVTGLLAGAAVLALRLAGTGLGASEVHSGSLPDALLDLALTGTAAGVLVLLARSPRARAAVTAATPVRAVGVLALTAYALHVALIALVTRTVGWEAAAASWPLYAGGVLLITVAGCWAWWVVLGRGPLERVLALLTDRIR